MRQVPFASFSASSGTFNSLFKVLFIFPSWYLFAISLKHIFQVKMKITTHFTLQYRRARLLECQPYTMDNKWWPGLSPSLAANLFQGGSHLNHRWWSISSLQFKAGSPDFNADLIPVHSPLLRKSYLVFIPPLTYMLKFSGSSGLTSCPGAWPENDEQPAKADHSFISHRLPSGHKVHLGNSHRPVQENWILTRESRHSFLFLGLSLLMHLSVVNRDRGEICISPPPKLINSSAHCAGSISRSTERCTKASPLWDSKLFSAGKKHGHWSKPSFEKPRRSHLRSRIY